MMGDRGNIIVKDGDSKVFLYTHWAGYRVADTIRKGLNRNERWTDGSYLARIMFCELISGDSEPLTGTTSYGISSTMGDGFEGADIILDVDAQTVSMYDGNLGEPKGDAVSFADFAAGTKLKGERSDD
jgi:hypothetical protein